MNQLAAFTLFIASLLLFPGTCWGGDAPPEGLRHARIEHKGVEYDVVWVNLEQRKLSLHWKRPDGKPHQNLRKLGQSLKQEGKRLLFATNAGIYARDHTPLGLHVAEGVELRGINQSNGGGNFFLMPNGVFYVDESGAHVTTTEEYAVRQPKPEVATQSGPLLVINGALHARFLVDATSKYIRNGVGVVSEKEVVFAISRRPVIFHDFGTLFQEKLACRDALYLDGSLSALYAPWAGLHDGGALLVGMLAVSEPAEKE